MRGPVQKPSCYLSVMSIQVPVAELAGVAAGYGESAYVLVGVGDGPPRVTHSRVEVDEEGVVTASIGRRAAAALRTNPTTCVLWPAAGDEPMSLIADAELDGDGADDGGPVRLRVTGAVRHRPA